MIKLTSNTWIWFVLSACPTLSLPFLPLLWWEEMHERAWKNFKQFTCTSKINKIWGHLGGSVGWTLTPEFHSAQGHGIKPQVGSLVGGESTWDSFSLCTSHIWQLHACACVHSHSLSQINLLWEIEYNVKNFKQFTCTSKINRIFIIP